MQRRALLPSNVGKAWSKDDEKFLITAFQDGKTVKEIAVHRGRTVRAIKSRPWPDDNTKMLLELVKRLSLVLFIEVFAYFF